MDFQLLKKLYGDNYFVQKLDCQLKIIDNSQNDVISRVILVMKTSQPLSQTQFSFL